MNSRLFILAPTRKLDPISLKRLLFGLQHPRFALPSVLLLMRWSLIPPFQPYSLYKPKLISVSGLFSVALSIVSLHPVVNWWVMVRSPDFPQRNKSLRLPDLLSKSNISRSHALVKSVQFIKKGGNQATLLYLEII